MCKMLSACRQCLHIQRRRQTAAHSCRVCFAAFGAGRQTDIKPKRASSCCAWLNAALQPSAGSD